MTNVEKFVSALSASKNTLFHFTDARNIASIQQHGLLPTREIAVRGLGTVTGGDEASLSIDRHKRFDGFVRLSFCRSHPMAHVAMQRGNIGQIRILKICPSVLLGEGVLIADRVATANDAQVGTANDMLINMDFEATYKRIDWSVPENQLRRSAAEKWEALVPRPITVQEILFGL